MCHCFRSRERPNSADGTATNDKNSAFSNDKSVLQLSFMQAYLICGCVVKIRLSDQYYWIGVFHPFLLQPAPLGARSRFSEGLSRLSRVSPGGIWHLFIAPMGDGEMRGGGERHLEFTMPLQNTFPACFNISILALSLDSTTTELHFPAYIELLWQRQEFLSVNVPSGLNWNMQNSL